MTWHFNYAECIIHHLAGNFGRELNLAIWWSDVGSLHFKSPNLLHKNYTCTVAQPQLWNISLWGHREVAKCLHSPVRTIPSCALATLCTLTWSVVVVFPSCGGCILHTVHHCYIRRIWA